MARTKRICFFSVGFAFNRLIRMRFYEKIFPKDVEIFLYTTDKYDGTSEEKYTSKWDLKRTKIFKTKYHPLKTLFNFRKFCKKNYIDAVSNLGHPFGGIPLIFESIGKKTKVLLYYLGDAIDYPKIDTFSKKGLISFFSLIPYWFLTKFSDKIATVAYNTYKKSPLFFLSRTNKFHYIHATVNTDLFISINKKLARKKIGILNEEKVILFVGKITRRKGGKLLRQVIESNPDIKFILIGKWLEKEIPRFNFKNITVIDKVLNEKLNYSYSAADLSFAYHLQGCQMGIVGAESLSCGTPILHTKRVAFPDSSAILRFNDDINEINRKIKEFFALSEKEREALKKEARKYAIKYLSDDTWKEKYLNFFLE